MPGDPEVDEQQLRSATAARRRALLMLGVAEAQHFFRWLSPWIHGLFSLALAMAFSMLIEQSKVLDGFEDAVVREVARQRELDNGIAPPGPHELRIQQLEVSARVRVEKLEQRSGVEGVIERLGGVAPIQRGALADLLKDLADRLPAAGPASAPIVAIDIDLTPLEGGATTDQEKTDMLTAMEALRKKAHVIAVVLPRAAGADGGRQARNDFMKEAQCTRVTSTATAGQAADGKRNALFFASPRLFHDAGSYPTKYPYQLRDNSPPELPPFYPSLGTLVLQQFEHRFAHDAPPDALLSREEKVLASTARQTLTALCEQAHATRPDGELLEDRMATPAAADIAKAYKERRYSWRLLDDPRLQQTVIDDIESINWASNLHDSVIDSPVLLLGIDGGASYDKFGIAGISPEAVSGASLHALQALSIKAQRSPLVEKLSGILVDFFLGALYWLTWHRFLHPLLKRVRRNMPDIGSWLVVGAPLLLGAILTWLCFKIVAIGMGVDLWINPIYIVASLLLGIYVDAWGDSEDGEGVDRKLRKRILGLPAARDALRSGFGERVENMRFAATSGYAPVTGMDELRVHAEVTRSRLGAAALTDAVVSAALRLVVLIAGWGYIVNELLKAGRS